MTHVACPIVQRHLAMHRCIKATGRKYRHVTGNDVRAAVLSRRSANNRAARKIFQNWKERGADPNASYASSGTPFPTRISTDLFLSHRPCGPNTPFLHHSPSLLATPNLIHHWLLFAVSISNMTVTIPTTLQPISESPERRSAESTPTRTPDLRFVRGHTRRRSAPPTDPTLDPATALVLAQARLSAAQAETTLQRTAADGLRVANAQLRAQNVELEERVRELEALLSPPQPLTPTTSTATDSGSSADGPA